MLRLVEGAGVLLLLSVFFAYVLAPAVPPVRRLVRVGRRRRPISDAAAILLLYVVIFVPASLLWRVSEPAVRHWVAVTAPASVDRLFAGGRIVPLETLIAHAPLAVELRARLLRGSARGAAALEHNARSTLAEIITAARYAVWLVVAPIIAFLLLAGAPAFQRSALRVLPHGHLQWRVEEYLRDVNSALAGYVRAQAAAGVIVGAACVAGFVLLGTRSAISLGVLAGILELIPAIGPLTVLLIATSQGDQVVAIVLFLVALRLVQDYVVYPRLDSPRHAPLDARGHPDCVGRRRARGRRRRHHRHSGRRLHLGEHAPLAGIPRNRAAAQVRERTVEVAVECPAL